MISDADRNFAAVLTPPGVGAIAVIRLHGPRVQEFLRASFSRPAVPRRCVHGELRDGGTVIDDPVVVLSADGCWVDMNVHGGAWVVQASLDLARRQGFSLVESREIPLPSFTLDASGELEREMLAYLPLATTELAVRVLLAQPTAWERLQRSEVRADDARRMLADRSLHWLLHPPRIAIVGIPNAGKSTLANQLFGQQRSITADVPGTTRDWVGETANLDGVAVILVDTPGIRSSEDPIETEAIGRAQDQIQLADTVVLVQDATKPADPQQQEMANRFPHAIRVLNKSDAADGSLVADTAIRTVATTGQGIDQLRSAIRRRFGCDAIDLNVPRCWTDRQREYLQQFK
jgi:tRNA modification GTPase